jgi:hypothetical protein
MNIKNINTAPVLPLDPKPRVEGNVRTQGSTDRDANGRRDNQEQEQKRHLTQQEFDDALKILGEHPGLKANDLVIKVESHEDARVILILDPQGKIVRRLSESQLWSATRDKDRQTGRILDKAM